MKIIVLMTLMFLGCAPIGLTSEARQQGWQCSWECGNCLAGAGCGDCNWDTQPEICKPEWMRKPCPHKNK